MGQLGGALIFDGLVGVVVTMIVVTVIAHQDRPEAIKRRNRNRVLVTLWVVLILRPLLDAGTNALPNSMVTPILGVVFLIGVAMAVFSARRARRRMSPDELAQARERLRRRRPYWLTAVGVLAALLVVLQLLPRHHH